jgi:hypothetical protein
VKSWLDRFAFGPVAAVRPWLLLKSTLLLLALDVWHTHLGPAWRYGAAGFNVAHFAWMNGLPMPTREAYVAMLVAVGVGAIVCAVMARPPRALLVLIAFLYTWGWSCSMHDSYQHHYLISLVLFGFCFFPQLDGKQLFGELGTARATSEAERAASKKKAAPVAARTVKSGEAASPVLAALPHGPVPRVYALGYTLVTSVAAIVYFFTAVSKSEVEWRDGAALRNITANGAHIPDVVELAHAVGMSDDTLFWLMGHGVIFVQISCALGYLLASSRDGESTLTERTRLGEQLAILHAERVRITIALVVVPIACLAASRIVGILPALVLFVVAAAVALPRSFHRFCFAPLGRPSAQAIVATLALFNAVSFHIGAEYIGLQIGWFSYYMILLALIALTPGHWLSALAMAITAPFRAKGAPLLSRWPLAAPVLGIVTAIVAVTAGTEVDIPGAYECSVLVAIASFVAGLSGMMRPELGSDRTRGVVAAGVAMLVLYLSVATAGERYDYYRFAGGDFRRRHEYRQALEAYRAADRYAPEGESRATQIQQMEQLIESGAQ